MAVIEASIQGFWNIPVQIGEREVSDYNSGGFRKRHERDRFIIIVIIVCLVVMKISSEACPLLQSIDRCEPPLSTYGGDRDFRHNDVDKETSETVVCCEKNDSQDSSYSKVALRGWS